MPSVYLSPSVQQFNPYLSGGTEEEYMNLVADAVEPYLIASGIEFGRNDPNESLTTAINESNEGKYDLHVSIHSNASPEDLKGQLRGTDVYYSPNSFYGKAMAEITRDNFKNIYPIPEEVNILPTTTLAEIKRTNAPAVLIEVAFHDNAEDEEWILNNIDSIGETIAKSITDYFGVPFVAPIVKEEDNDKFIMSKLF